MVQDLSTMKDKSDLAHWKNMVQDHQISFVLFGKIWCKTFLL